MVTYMESWNNLNMLMELLMCKMEKRLAYHSMEMTTTMDIILNRIFKSKIKIITKLKSIVPKIF